ncbi:hypothetical protein MC885_003593 [Smutsia gigantea]|nr:hypothetical protein MC885_003593 [Smutsia gigantea]
MFTKEDIVHTELFYADLFFWKCVFVADGVDGKQARRTSSSTPLGELFDHGLDSWSCVYFVVTVYSIFGRGPSGVSVFVLYLLLWVVLFSFILSHWEKYNTGILFLPWGYDISQVTISLVYIVTSIVGVEAWYEPFLFNFLYRDLFTAMIIGIDVFAVFSLCIMCDSSNEFIKLFQCQLIVCQMSSTRCPTLNWLLVPLFLVVVVVNLGVASNLESILLYTLTTAFTLAHVHYGVRVVSNLEQTGKAAEQPFSDLPLLIEETKLRLTRNGRKEYWPVIYRKKYCK